MTTASLDVGKRQYHCADAIPELTSHAWGVYQTVTSKTRHICLYVFGVDELIELWHRFPHICSLCLHASYGASFLGAAFDSFAKSLCVETVCSSNGIKIRYLDLSRMDLCDRHVPLLVRLCSIHPIERLNLNSNSLASGTRALFDFLAQGQQTTLKQLLLDTNKISDPQAWQSLCRLVAQTKHLTMLSVKNNRLLATEPEEKRFAVEMEKAIEKNQTLTHLYFQGCFATKFCGGMMRNNLHVRESDIWFRERLYPERNRHLFAHDNMFAAMVNLILPLLHCSVPVYVALHIFDLVLCIRQYEFVDTGAVIDNAAVIDNGAVIDTSASGAAAVADFDVVERYCSAKKLRWLKTLSLKARK